MYIIVMVLFSKKIKNQERGVALLLTFFILNVIFVIAIAFSSVVLREFEITSGASHSFRALYAADAGVEKIQYIIFREAGIWETTPTSASGVIAGGGTYDAVSRKTVPPCIPDVGDDEVDCILSDGSFRETRRSIEINLLP